MSAPNPSAESKEYVPPDSHRLHAAYSHKTLQAFHNDAPLLKQHVVYPIFVTTDPNAKEPIKALPNQHRWGVNRLEEFLGPLVQRGLESVIIFGVVGEQHAKVKDACGSFGTDPSSPVASALRLLASKYPDLLLMCDVCLCGYTDHGHCGIVDDKGRIDNQKSIARLAELAVFYAENGAHVVAPSDMMDGRIGAIKHALKQRGGTLFDRVAVLSYAAKFASCLYGPFREAAASGMKFGDRTLYQLPPHARGLALRAVERDLEEGADMVMVKPGGFYLDLVRETKDLSRVPVAVYQVSGEYAMLYHAAAAGCFDLRTGVLESLVAMRRAGADMILTYYAPELMEWL